MHILVIEDDPHISGFLKQGFEELQYQVTCCGDGKQGYQLATMELYDLIVLDLMLPTWDGMEVLRRIRGEGHQIPILILSARHSVEERVLGLQSGADDYLVKPFAFAELAARCQILSRRQVVSHNANQLSYHDLTLDLLTRKLCRDGHDILLKQREFALMQLFIQQPERVFSKTVILENIWGFQFDPQTNVVDVLVCRLRAQVDKGFEMPLIHTIRGVGYVLKYER
ncbi:DNA-binding response regulator [Photobacterium profundum]|uniref:Probable two-component system response regulator (Pho family) n=1 Tax=Photobacterium profundum 3TCK TaxID=314280 RepID=Q1Z644_9GAMM|nr:response regulator transcription factor [Photobacterium profundum]EAS44000.1 probable two-component system response regulator (Pho family) [Photobacterium profundum 3TCK]PSV61808.1 DNA-binding response regulator [Photobacterium profundum]